MINTLDDRELEESRQMIEAIYLQGGCMAFAVMAHHRTGWPVVTLRDRDGSLVHAGLRHPDGGFFDVRGQLDEAGFSDRFWGTLTDDTAEAVLNEYPQPPHVLERTDNHIDILFPGLPGESASRKAIEAFTSDLEELCRRHGYWIRSTIAHGMALYHAPDDNTRYDVTLHAAGGMTLERVLLPDLETDLSSVPKP